MGGPRATLGVPIARMYSDGRTVNLTRPVDHAQPTDHSRGRTCSGRLGSSSSSSGRNLVAASSRYLIQLSRTTLLDRPRGLHFSRPLLLCVLLLLLCFVEKYPPPTSSPSLYPSPESPSPSGPNHLVSPPSIHVRPDFVPLPHRSLRVSSPAPHASRRRRQKANRSHLRWRARARNTDVPVVPGDEESSAKERAGDKQLAQSGRTEGDDAWRSPYVIPRAIDLTRGSTCQRVTPAADGYSRNRRAPVASIADVASSADRLLLVFPRHGLGNSLRGFVSAFVYSQLARRRLVRFHGAEHARVFDALCHAFECGFDAVRGAKGTGQGDEEEAEEEQKEGAVDTHRGPLGGLRYVDLQAYPRSLALRQSFSSPAPLMVSKSPRHFDGFWRHYPSVQQCVRAAFSCHDTWCVHSIALRQLLKRPSQALLSAARGILQHRAFDGASGGDGGYGNGNRGSADGGSESVRSKLSSGSSVARESSSASASQHCTGSPASAFASGRMFDVAVHVRTRDAAIEGATGAGAADGTGPTTNAAKVGCQDEQPSHSSSSSSSRFGRDDSDSEVSPFLRSCLWQCLSRVLSQVPEERMTEMQDCNIYSSERDHPNRTDSGDEVQVRRPLSILLATDNEQLRDQFAQHLSAHGDVYFSSGSIVHSSKSASNDTTDQLPTLAEFYLMSRAHMVLEAGPYVSTFARLAALLGNGTLAGVKWRMDGSCLLDPVHKGIKLEMGEPTPVLM